MGCSDFLSPEQNLAAIGLLQPHQHLGQGGFAATGFTHNRDGFPCPGSKADIVIGNHNTFGFGAEHDIGGDIVMFAHVFNRQQHLTDFGLLTTGPGRRFFVPVNVLYSQATALMGAGAIHPDHIDLAGITDIFTEIGASRAEIASVRTFMRQGKLAVNRHQRRVGFVLAGKRYGA